MLIFNFRDKENRHVQSILCLKNYKQQEDASFWNNLLLKGCHKLRGKEEAQTIWKRCMAEKKHDLTEIVGLPESLAVKVYR